VIPVDTKLEHECFDMAHSQRIHSILFACRYK
jgi:hypothetical protein